MKKLLIGALCGLSLACGPGQDLGQEPAASEEAVGQAEGALVTPTLLSWNSPVDLIASTGNLYWTSYAIDEFGPDSASVWRASKSNTPGSEILLYRESGDVADFRYFGSLCYAQISGAWFGYFVANYGSVSQIKRIPLTGGSATVLATSPGQIGTRDLVTDGATLFWTDSAGLRSMPIGGGAITTLFSGGALSRLVIDGARLVFNSGGTLLAMAKTGGFTSTIASESTNISALSTNGTGTVYWGTEGAAVRSRNGTSSVTTYQSPTAGRRASSVTFDGSRVVWSDCVSPNGNGCAVKTKVLWFVQTLTSGGVGTGNLQSDASNVFFGEAGGLKKI